MLNSTQLNDVLRGAGYGTKKEQKYKCTEKRDCVRIKPVPGDILIESWSENHVNNLYLNIVVGNVVADAYVIETS